MINICVAQCAPSGTNNQVIVIYKHTQIDKLFLGITKKIHTKIDHLLMTFMNIYIHSNAETSKSHRTGHKREILKYDTYRAKGNQEIITFCFLLALSTNPRFHLSVGPLLRLRKTF